MVTTLLSSAGSPSETIRLWPGTVVGDPVGVETEKAIVSGNPPVTRIHHVSQPEMQVFPAPESRANGAAVIICPGGGYNILAFDKEGTEVAQWLNTLGITAIVLKYRVPRQENEPPHLRPLQDLQRAIRLVRQKAEMWKIDRDRIGVMGFSAGGHLTVMAGTNWDVRTYEPIDEADGLSCRPDFMIPIYPAYLGDGGGPDELSPLVRVTPETPPAFIATAYDDGNWSIDAALLLIALKKAKVPSELHIYSRGGHGYGLRPSKNPVSSWPDRCEDWLRVAGFLEPGHTDP